VNGRCALVFDPLEVPVTARGVNLRHMWAPQTSNPGSEWLCSSHHRTGWRRYWHQEKHALTCACSLPRDALSVPQESWFAFVMDGSTKDLLKAAIAQFNLSRRAQNIEMYHVADEINYRAFDSKLFG